MSTLDRSKSSAGERGFSLAEMMIVVAIVLVVAAFAVPQVINGMRNLRLRSSATNVASIIQQTRQRAVRDNANYAALPAVLNGQPIIFIDVNNNGAYNAGDPMVMLGSDVVLNPAAPNQPNLQALVTPPPPGGGVAPPMDFRVTTGVPIANPPAFNARGWPCVPNAFGGGGNPITSCTTAGVAGNPVGYGYFLQSTSLPIDGWAAVTISPAGRIKTWGCTPLARGGCQWR